MAIKRVAGEIRRPFRSMAPAGKFRQGMMKAYRGAIAKGPMSRMRAGKGRKVRLPMLAGKG